MSYTRVRYERLEDWLRLRPLLALYKLTYRYLIGRIYVHKRAPNPRALASLCQRLGTRPLVVTVAYRSAWMLKWHLAFGAVNLRGTDRLVVDNSPDTESAREIETLCREAGVHYLKLPFNRFSLGRPKDASLSHACALNWTWQHIVAVVRPPVVALLDHDLIALKPVDLSAKLDGQPFFGVKKTGKHQCWQIWPGYAIFDRSIVERYQADFWVDSRNVELDTGGANWRRIFRHFDDQHLRFADAPPFALGRFEEWWHIGGASEYGGASADWRESIETALTSEYAAIAK
jgi:hypothetical protein